MDLILWRHAEAEDTVPDLSRELTRKGCKQAQKMATWLKGQFPDEAHFEHYASEALRVKAFVGQRKFQAPVADDFIRGLRAPGQASHPDAQVARQAHWVWGALTNGLAAWWRG